MTDSKYKSNRLNILLIISLLGLVAYIGWPEQPSTAEEIDRTELIEQKKDRDSIIVRVDTVTRIVTKIVTRYKIIRHDSLIPCHEKLQVCDTVVNLQDSLIRELQILVKKDFEIISNQDTLIKNQDLTIKDLTKSVKREKRKRRIIVAITALIVGIAIVK